VIRDKTTIGALEYVPLDGHALDLWADFGDGRAVRPVMIAWVDVASNVGPDFELAPSENASATVRLITRVCEAHGIFDRLSTDNGSAFAGHLVSGGVGRGVRTSGRAMGAPTPPRVYEHLGIAATFALPGNARDDGQARLGDAPAQRGRPRRLRRGPCRARTRCGSGGGCGAYAYRPRGSGLPPRGRPL
jgi:hypothetical protein